MYMFPYRRASWGLNSNLSRMKSTIPGRPCSAYAWFCSCARRGVTFGVFAGPQRDKFDLPVSQGVQIRAELRHKWHNTHNEPLLG